MTQHTIKFEFISMTTRCVLQLVHHDEAHIHQVAQDIFDNTKRLEEKYNFFNPNSWLTQTINQRHKQSVALDDEAWQIFQKINSLSKLTDNLFDVTIGSLRIPTFLKNSSNPHIQHLQTLYRQGKTRSDIIQEYQNVLGLHAWSLDNQQKTLHFFDERTRMDLGGVIKEYAVDEAMTMVKNSDCRGMISFGGDLRVFGKKANGEDYKVGIKNPFNPQQTCLSLTLKNQALTTSGNYERQDEIENQRFPHIISNQQSNHHESVQDKQMMSVTVISDETLVSGVFSTALMINPSLKLPDIHHFGRMDVMMIDTNANLLALSNQPKV